MTLLALRGEIDVLNRELLLICAKRIEVAKQIARIKKAEQLPILDQEREAQLLEEIRAAAKQLGLSPAVMEELFSLLLSYTRLEMKLELGG